MDIVIENNGVRETFTPNTLAKQANGSIFYKQGKTAILATVATDLNANIEGDFLPLTVQYVEKAYANGKIPGGYVKREGKPSEYEILTSRLIDRSLRPLFPKSYRYPVQITIIVLSADKDLDLQVMSLNAASMALFVSNIPINRPLNAVRVAKIDSQTIINPTLGELAKSSLDLFISGEFHNILMIECKAKILQIAEDELIAAIAKARDSINATSSLYKAHLEPHIKPNFAFEMPSGESPQALDFITKNYKERLESCFLAMSKSENSALLLALRRVILANCEFSEIDIDVAIAKFKRDFIRGRILHSGIRLDGRTLDEIRPISIATNILPKAHGSALFTRGETQVLAVCTLGGDNDMQSFETLTQKTPLKSKFSFHYNFPSFCTGEAYPIGSPTRRELGHGNLAKKALESSIAHDKRAIRIVSEVLESNGSSSMASVCGGSLSLCAAGVEPLFLVAGIAMGLVKEGENYKILTDIMGIEDYDGDMDFKVAGNLEGITALQMDIKTDNVSLEILKDALQRARAARIQILDLMTKARDAIIPSEGLPKVATFSVQAAKIPSIIGQGGKNIKDIIERFGVQIDINKESAEVSVYGDETEAVNGAREAILACGNRGADFQIGERFNGKIKKIMDFGIFVELRDGIDGLLHQSKLARRHANLANFHEGGNLAVVIVAINNGKVELDMSE